MSQPPQTTKQANTQSNNALKKGGVIASIVTLMIVGVVHLEGGYVNNKNDPGGETNMGITKTVALQAGYVGPMKTLPQSVANNIYFNQYLVKPGYYALVPYDAPVVEELFDTTVNMGAARPSLWFQQSINQYCGTKLVTDGKVGAGTINAYRACQVSYGAVRLCKTMLDSLDGKQKAEYTRLVLVNPKLKVFYKGWTTHRIGNVDRQKCSEQLNLKD